MLRAAYRNFGVTQSAHGGDRSLRRRDDAGGPRAGHRRDLLRDHRTWRRFSTDLAHHRRGRPKPAKWSGCSGVGVIASESEVESGPALSVLVFGGEEVNAKRLFVPSLRNRGREVALELAVAVKPALGRSNLLCIFADTYNMNADLFLAALEAELPGVVIVGGGASEDGSIGETFQFCGDTVSSNSVSAMLISGDFDLKVGASLACTQIGPMHRVTEVRDNVVIALDGRPAYEVFAEAAGPLAADLRRALAFVFVGIPLDENPRAPPARPLPGPQHCGCERGAWSDRRRASSAGR